MATPNILKSENSAESKITNLFIFEIIDIRCQIIKVLTIIMFQIPIIFPKIPISDDSRFQQKLQKIPIQETTGKVFSIVFSKYVRYQSVFFVYEKSMYCTGIE